MPAVITEEGIDVDVIIYSGQIAQDHVDGLPRDVVVTLAHHEAT
jgi:hypothetical protein